MGCIGLCKHSGVPFEFGKMREIGKMCHFMSIIEKVTCMGGFNVLVSEFLVVSGRKDGVDLILKDLFAC